MPGTRLSSSGRRRLCTCRHKPWSLHGTRPEQWQQHLYMSLPVVKPHPLQRSLLHLFLHSLSEGLRQLAQM